MKCLYVFSDSHGDLTIMQNILDCNPTAHIVFLGDMNKDIEQMQARYPKANYIIVEGNNDFSRRYPTVSTILVEDVSIFLCHGHTLCVKYSLEALFQKAKEHFCPLALFGHTHFPMIETRNDITLLNPGSCASSYGTYAQIIIVKNTFTITHHKGDGSKLVL